jgi:hypothetical protein
MSSKLCNPDIQTNDKSVLNFFIAANAIITNKKLENYGLTDNNAPNPHYPAAIQGLLGGSPNQYLFDLIPAELTQNHFKTRLRCKYGKRTIL